MPHKLKAARTPSAANTPGRAERLEARITSEQKRLIERAAQLRGTSLTDFVVAELQQAATAAIRDYEILNLRDEGRELFLNMLLNPPQPNRAAKRAAAQYKKRMRLVEPNGAVVGRTKR